MTLPLLPVSLFSLDDPLWHSRTNASQERRTDMLTAMMPRQLLSPKFAHCKRCKLYRCDAPLCILTQVPEDQQPRYSNYKEPLAPVDASLVNQVVTEFCAAYSAAMSEHDIARGEYVKGFRDK